MEHLHLSGDEPLPSTDEDSVFVGEKNKKGMAEDDDAHDGKVGAVAVPAPGGGGVFAVPVEYDADAAKEGREQ
jgi:hypothetical protein